MASRNSYGIPIVSRPRRSLGSAVIQTPEKVFRGQHSRHRSAYDRNDVRFVPEVPRIPDKYLPRSEEPNPSAAQEIVLHTADEKVSLNSHPAPYTQYLPNCSFGKPQQIQVISNAMMQAYVAMRGNAMGGQGENDPLFEWIRQREDLAQASQPRIHQQRDVSRLLALIDRALDSGSMSFDSPRDSVFEVHRPDFDHIKPPQDMDMSASIFSACCSDFEWAEDSDNEEAHVPTGRISPCTFLEWSKDCVRWNADETQEKKDTAAYQKMRPAALNAPVYPRQHKYRAGSFLEPQWDVNTGEELTPTYYVPSSPSIIWSPPGVDFEGFPTIDFHQQYRLMAPLMERELRTQLYGGDVVPPHLSDDEDHFISSAEADAATAAAAATEHYGRQPPEITAAFRDQWDTIHRTEAAEIDLYKTTELQRAHIERLQYDRRHLHEFMPALHVRREERDAKAREQIKKLRRGSRIRAYVAEHALETQSRLDTAWKRLSSTQVKANKNLRRIADLESELRELCFQAGVRDVEHAYVVLMGAESDDGGQSEAGPATQAPVYAPVQINGLSPFLAPVPVSTLAPAGANFAVNANVNASFYPNEDIRGNTNGINNGNLRGNTHGNGNCNGTANGYGAYGYGSGFDGGVVGGINGIGNGIGIGNGPFLGPWSPSSLGRAEEEYDRLLANMRSTDKGKEVIRECERRFGFDDNASRDSGVAGVGHYDHYPSRQPAPNGPYMGHRG
ncbi:hypothetical protein F4808DRAFT_467720 [Astrocystis sublimbata]|nr:hypothetical protein F4808DRAFT_467720 [Astrocystis sublimbata]